MKFKIGLLLLILGIFAATPYLMRNGGSLPLLEDEITDILSTEQTRQEFHKWQDAHGKWHFGEAPPEGIATTVVKIDTAANVIRSVKMATSESVEKQERKLAKTDKPPLPMTVSPDQATNLMEDARNVESLLSERTKQLDAIR